MEAETVLFFACLLVPVYAGSTVMKDVIILVVSGLGVVEVIEI